jgi:hypothetical protein
MIHEPSGKPIKYLKGIETEQGFPRKRSSRATSTPKAITFSSSPKRLMS